jgi:serine phosphatase RsbU (regulator of sigma subunit)
MTKPPFDHATPLLAPQRFAEALRIIRPLFIPSMIFCALLTVLTLNADPTPFSGAMVFWNVLESFGTGLGTLGAFILLAPLSAWMFQRGWRNAVLRTVSGLLALLIAQVVVNAVVLAFGPAGRGEEKWQTLLINWLVLGLVSCVLVLIADRVQLELRRGREAVRRNALLGQELALAQEIQANLIPQRFAGAPGLDVASGYYPAREVGGDLLSYQMMPNGCLSLSVGDVTGKSMSAALLMGLTLGALRAEVRDHEHPATVLDELSDLLREHTGGRRFVALSNALIDPARRSMLVANAGQPDPILRTRDGARYLELPAGMPLGIGPKAPSREVELRLEAGDALVFYTDGVVEAHNSAGELFGFDRLLALVEAQPPGAPAQDIRLAITNAVSEFSAGTPAHDDITLMVVRMTSS